MSKAAAVAEATTYSTVTLTHERETPGTHLFKTDDPDSPITSLYVKKSAFTDLAVPQTITVTVTDA